MYMYMFRCVILVFVLAGGFPMQFTTILSKYCKLIIRVLFTKMLSRNIRFLWSLSVAKDYQCHPLRQYIQESNRYMKISSVSGGEVISAMLERKSFFLLKISFLSVTIYWTVIVHENIMSQYANGSTENVIYWYVNIM